MDLPAGRAPGTLHVSVEQPTLRRVVEHLTLLTLLAAVSLYAVGQFQSWKYIQSFSIPTTGLERSWETYVFGGAVAVINLLLHLGPASLRWLLPLLLTLGGWRVWRRLATRPERSVARLLAGLFVAGGYVFFLLMLGISWGLENARLVKELPAPPEWYVVTPEAQASLPAGFLAANAKGALRFVASGSDAIFLYDPEGRATYALPTRLVVCRVYAPRP